MTIRDRRNLDNSCLMRTFIISTLCQISRRR